MQTVMQQRYVVSSEAQSIISRIGEAMGEGMATSTGDVLLTYISSKFLSEMHQAQATGILNEGTSCTVDKG